MALCVCCVCVCCVCEFGATRQRPCLGGATSERTVADAVCAQKSGARARQRCVPQTHTYTHKQNTQQRRVRAHHLHALPTTTTAGDPTPPRALSRSPRYFASCPLSEREKGVAVRFDGPASGADEEVNGTAARCAACVQTGGAWGTLRESAKEGKKRKRHKKRRDSRLLLAVSPPHPSPCVFGRARSPPPRRLPSPAPHGHT